MQLFSNLKAATKRRRARRDWSIEGLETRLALSTASPFSSLSAIGYVGGRAFDVNTGLGVGGVKVQLIDAGNQVEATTRTGSSGQYLLPVDHSGSFVVREVTPHVYTQLLPTFASTAPVGSFSGKYGNSSWNYSSVNTNPTKGPVGPAGWVSIALAGADGFESPINITTKATNLGGILGVNFNPAVPKQTINNSHQIQVQFNKSRATSMTVNGQVFKLAQFHFHEPAETTLHGRHATMELHFVLTDQAGAETVLAVFMKVGKFNPALQPVLTAALNGLNAPNTTTPAPTSPIDFAGLLPARRDGTLNLQGWYYTGSLTTPPLSQPVNWFLLQQPIQLSGDQLRQYETVAAGSGFLPNARPTQSLDGRRLNEIDYQIDFQTTSLANLNFVLAPKVPYIY